MNRYYLDDKDYLAGLLGLFFALLTMVMLLFCLSKYIHISVDAVELKQIYKTNFALNPEPQERLLFLIGCVFMPIALWLFYNLFAKVLAGVRGKRLISNYTRFLYLAVIAVLYCYTFFLVRKGGYLGGYFLLQGALGLTPLNLFSICLAGVVILLALIYEKKNYKVSIICKITNLSVIVFALLAIISVVVFCVFGRSSVSIRGVADYHFNSVFNPVGQVYFGKCLLTNSVSLYGLYPHFIEPLFRLWGLSIFSFTLLMGILMGIALSALFLFLRDITENKLIGYLGFIAMVYFHYYCTRAYGGDPYFQYSPVRFLFPAVSIYLTYRYLNSSNNKLYYFCFILFAIGPFWNFDHGIVVFLSWMFVLIYRELLKREFKRIWKHIFLGLIAFSAVFIAFFLYVLLRYQQLPNWSSLLFYPRLYYTYGFSMMPMPPVHLWHMIILLYLVGLLLSIIYLRRRIATPKIEMVFYLSIIGVGIFYYYQGRSHDLTLVAVNYPAIILLTIYADSMLSRIRMRNRFSDILFVTGILCFMLYAAASLIGRGEDIYRIIHSRWVPLIKKESNSITEVADFVKNNTYKGEEVLIFSNLSAVLYFESGTTCPLALPNANDIYLVAQYEEIRKYLEDDSPSKVIAYMDDRVYKHIAKYLKDHKLVNQSNTGGLVVYVKE